MKKLLKFIFILVALVLIISAAAQALGLVSFRKFDVSDLSIASAVITDGLTGKSVEITSPEQIRQIVDRIRESGAGFGTPIGGSGFHYSLRLNNAAGEAVFSLELMTPTEIQINNFRFNADFSELFAYLQSLFPSVQ